MKTDGFVDLRIDQYADESNEGFWPSFTDIMTVIVMIFLLSMVVLMVHNMELVHRLQDSVKAERQAAQIARANAIAKSSLDAQLNDSEAELALLRYRLSEADEDAKVRRNRLLSQEILIEQLKLEQQLGKQNLTQLKQENQQLLDTLTGANSKLLENQVQLAQLKQVNQSRQQQLTAFLSESRQQLQTIQTLQSVAQSNKKALTLATDDYTQLKTKYDKLVKPARSSQGKILVEVYHRKDKDRKIFRVKLPGTKKLVDISEIALNQKLTALKLRYPGKLYIKIVFPKDSGLSYSEAWKFTNQMLVKYDSYYNTKK